MLKPRKTRKNRAQITFREDGGTTYYSPNRKPLKHTKEQVDTLAKIVFQRPANIWYGMRAIQAHNNRPDYPYHALRAMSEKDWNFHWQWKEITALTKDNQLEHASLPGVIDPLTRMWEPRFLSDMPYLARKVRLTDFLIGTDPGRPEGVALATVVKGRRPGLFSADAIRTGKSDWQLHAAMAQGADAVKELIAQRLAALPDTEMPLNRERWAGLIDENQPVAKASRMPLPAGRLKMSREFSQTEIINARDAFTNTIGGNKPLGVHLKQSVPVLNNPDLVGVDPYSPDLTTEQKAAIVAEAKINSAYFFSILRNPAPDGSRTTPFTDDEKQEIQLHYEYHHPYHNLDVSTKYYFPVVPSDEVFAFPGRGMTPFTPQHDPDHLNLPLDSELEDE